MVKFGNDWDEILAPQFDMPYYKQLREFLKQEYKTRTIYPDMYDIYNAFKYSSYSGTKVVIIGQDPYHGPRQAHGLCFSVQKGVEKPPSLKNIFKELEDDLGIKQPSHGDLTYIAKQGVLLLNSALTVRAGMANSHKDKGWEIFTDNVIKILNDREKPLVFILWGNYAIKKAKLVTNERHAILTAAHPSPLSAHNGFFGCRHFSKTNKLLEEMGQEPIDWQIPE